MKEAHRRKYHRDNHLLPHERFLQQDQLDQSIQQDTRQELQELQQTQAADPPLNSLSDRRCDTHSNHAHLTLVDLSEFLKRSASLFAEVSTPQAV